MTFRVEWLMPHLISIVASLLMALAAWKRPTLGRTLFVLLFAWAAQFNLRTALAAPAAYLDYAALTDSTTMRRLILGPFAAHAQAYVVLIAVAHACIAIGLTLRGKVASVAAVGAIAFFVAIAPLGVGSAFPSSLILAGAMALLLRDGFATTLLRDLRHRLRPPPRLT